MATKTWGKERVVTHNPCSRSQRAPSPRETTKSAQSGHRGAACHAGPQENARAGDDDGDITAKQPVSQWNQVGQEILRRHRNVQPTLTIRPGHRFNIVVEKDLIFEAPYLG